MSDLSATRTPSSAPALPPERDVSLRLKVVRFPLSVGTVFAHSYETAVALAQGTLGVAQGTAVAVFVINFFSYGLGRVAVPLFFIMSGYLFFAGLRWSRQLYFSKLKNRTFTLILPYLFWNVAVLALLALAQALPVTQGYFSGNNSGYGAVIAGYSALDYLNALLGFETGYPIAYQLWFIRDLAVMVLLAPLLHLALRTIPLLLLAAAAGLWLLNIWPEDAGTIPSVRAVLFFSLGSYLAIGKHNLFGLDRYGVPIVLAYLVLVTCDALTRGQIYNPYLHHLGVAFGVASALYLTRQIVRHPRLTSLLVRLSSITFFIFAAHEPLLTILRKLAYRVVAPTSSEMVLMLYFAVPLLTIATLVATYYALLALAPRFTKFITGGRAQRQRPAPAASPSPVGLPAAPALSNLQSMTGVSARPMRDIPK